jgi:hypothetical protein
LSEEVLIRELWSRDTPLPIEHLTDTQQFEIVREILLAPNHLTDELRDVVTEAFKKHFERSLEVIHKFPLSSVLEELAFYHKPPDILIALAGGY